MSVESRKIVKAIRSRLGRMRGQFPEYAVCCPLCSDRRWRLYINVSKEVGYCFNCDARLSSGKLKELLGLKVALEETDIEILEAELETLTRGEFLSGFLDRPASGSCSVQGLLFSEIDAGSNLYYRTLKHLTWQHLDSRGFDPEQVARDYRFLAPAPGSFKNPRLVLPIYESDELVFYQARSLDDGQPKYLNPRKGARRGKSEFVFNLDRIDPEQPVLICEGIFSAIAAGPQAVAVLGKTISSAQYFKILSAGVEEVTILFDPGAEQQALESGNLLRGALDVRVAFLEGGDPNEVEPDALAAVIAAAKTLEELEEEAGLASILM